MDYSKTIRISKALRDSFMFRGRHRTSSLPKSIHRFFALLDKQRIEHLLVGGLALLQYVRIRNTDDIDMIISEASLKKLSQVEIIEQENHFVYGRFDELEVNFFLSSDPLFEKVLRECATNQRFEEKVIPCATVKGLLLLKLYALPSLYREGNFIRTSICENDIAVLIYYYKPQISELLDELSPYLTETELGELLRVSADIEARIKRFRRHFRCHEEKNNK